VFAPIYFVARTRQPYVNWRCGSLVPNNREDIAMSNLSGCRTPISPIVFLSRPVTLASLTCTAALPLSQSWLNEVTGRAEW
jgi:hypothetical protein